MCPLMLSFRFPGLVLFTVGYHVNNTLWWKTNIALDFSVIANFEDSHHIWMETRLYLSPQNNQWYKGFNLPPFAKCHIDAEGLLQPCSEHNGPLCYLKKKRQNSVTKPWGISIAEKCEEFRTALILKWFSPSGVACSEGIPCPCSQFNKSLLYNT